MPAKAGIHLETKGTLWIRNESSLRPASAGMSNSGTTGNLMVEHFENTVIVSESRRCLSGESNYEPFDALSRSASGIACSG